MKKTLAAFAAIAALSFSFVSCADKAEGAKAQGGEATSAADASYAFGLAIGSDDTQARPEITITIDSTQAKIGRSRNNFV